MTSIRFRLFLLFTFFAGTTLLLANLAFRGFQNYREDRHQLELSYMLMEELKGGDFSSLTVNSDGMQRLRKLRAKMKPQRRLDEVSDLIQSLNAGSPRPVKSRYDTLVKNETEFRRFTRDEIDYLEKRLLYYGSLSLVILLLGFGLLQIFVSNSIIRPMRDLSRKMVDFLNDRYTYQFSVPAPDEIGHMQATFNSLAQRVITNMEQLRTLDSAKSEFLSIASHELRTPLTSIKGSLSLLRSGIVGPMNEMADNLLGIAETETDRLIRLINDILDLAKIEAQKLPLHQDWNSFQSLTKITLESLQGLAGQAEVTLVANDIPSIESYSDRDRVQQVLTNLLSNAIKFSPKGASVFVNCEINPKQELLIEVRDQGRGIAPEDQEAIFQKFRQATNSRNPLVKGTGLGLAIARALVEQHGGTIGVRSKVGEGSCFYFTIPEWRFKNQEREVAA